MRLFGYSMKSYDICLRGVKSPKQKSEMIGRLEGEYLKQCFEYDCLTWVYLVWFTGGENIFYALVCIYAPIFIPACTGFSPSLREEL